MARKIVAGNWKMNLNRDEAFALVSEITGMLKARAALVDEEMNQAAEQAALEAAEVDDSGHVYTCACVRTFVFVRIHMHIWSILFAEWVGGGGEF